MLKAVLRGGDEDDAEGLHKLDAVHCSAIQRKQSGLLVSQVSMLIFDGWE